MKKILIIAAIFLLAGCAPDQIPHCSRCDRKYALNHPGKDSTYTLCDKTYEEIRAWEAREDVKYPYSQTDCVARDTKK